VHISGVLRHLTTARRQVGGQSGCLFRTEHYSTLQNDHNTENMHISDWTRSSAFSLRGVGGGGCGLDLQLQGEQRLLSHAVEAEELLVEGLRQALPLAGLSNCTPHSVNDFGCLQEPLGGICLC